MSTPLNKQTIKIVGWVLRDMLELQNRHVNGTSRTSQPFKIRRGAKYDPTIEAVGSSGGLVATLHLPYHYFTCPITALIGSWDPSVVGKSAVTASYGDLCSESCYRSARLTEHHNLLLLTVTSGARREHYQQEGKGALPCSARFVTLSQGPHTWLGLKNDGNACSPRKQRLSIGLQ